jgi:hypothetical protein
LTWRNRLSSTSSRPFPSRKIQTSIRVYYMSFIWYQNWLWFSQCFSKVFGGVQKFVDWKLEGRVSARPDRANRLGNERQWAGRPRPSVPGERDSSRLAKEKKIRTD